VERNGDNVLLEIAPRVHAIGRPPERRCGEVAIQEALKNPKPLISCQAKQQVYAVHDTIARESPAVYRCQKAPSER
jgi:hypothetical protein